MDNRKQLFRNANICKSSPLNPEIAPSLALYSTYKLNFHCLLPPKHEEMIWCDLGSHFNACLLSKSGFDFSPCRAGLFIWKDLMNKQEQTAQDEQPRLSSPEVCSTCASGGPPACFLDCDKHEARFHLSGSILSGWFTHQWFVLKNTFPWISVLTITAVRQACPQLAEQDDFTWV